MVETGHTKVGIMIQKVNFEYLKKKTNTLTSKQTNKQINKHKIS